MCKRPLARPSSSASLLYSTSLIISYSQCRCGLTSQAPSNGVGILLTRNESLVKLCGNAAGGPVQLAKGRVG